jgi:hypothetical protein
MPSTGLHGPWPLTEKDIDAVVRGVGAGAYALTREGTEPTFIVNYVGRSDNDLRGRLKQWVNSRYTHFKYGFLPTSTDAFLKECHLYHDFGGPEGKLDNEMHPARAQGTTWSCPSVGCDALRW